MLADPMRRVWNRAQDAISGFAIEGKLLDTQKEKLDEVLKKYPLIGQAAQEAGNLATFGAMQMIDGAQTAEQVFANFLRSIADLLMRSAAQMITTYIAIGVARMFAGVPAIQSAGDKYGSVAMGGGGPTFKPSAFGKGSLLPASEALLGRANGGAVSAGRPYMVGERGPELFIPGANGNIVPNDAMGGVQVGSINITVENTGEQLSPAAQKQIANQVQGIVMSTLVNERRSGGVLR